MVVELTVINLVPPNPEGMSAANFIPMRVFQKKLFILENMGPEQCVTTKGKLVPKYSVAKYEGEYYKLKIPYEELKALYTNDKPIIKGFGNA